MKSRNWVLLAVVTTLIGCGSSSSSQDKKSDAATKADAPATGGDAPADSVPIGKDTAASDTARDAGVPPADTTQTVPIDAEKADVGTTLDVSAPDTMPSLDTSAGVDQSPGMDTPVPDSPPADVPPTPDAAPRADASAASATGVQSSTSTDDPSADTTVCATIKVKNVALTADQTLDIVMPDCLRLSGTVTLGSPLPAGAVFMSGKVQAFKLDRDASNKVVDATTYDAQITNVDATHVKYSVGVPAGTYEIMYRFDLKSSDTIPSTASRIGQDRVALSKNTIHDVTLSALDLITSTVTVTGSDALPTNGVAYGRYLAVFGVNSSNTILVNGMSMSVAASTTITMWLPNEPFTPTLLEYDSQSSTAPFASGYVSEFQLDPVAAASAITLPLPAITKISGTVSDPNGVLSPMNTVGTSGNSAPNYYQCNTLDYGNYPNPIFLFPEGSASYFFSASTSHTVYARKGATCVPYANYAIAVGPGGLPVRTGENTYAYMMDPTPKSPNAITLGADVVRNIDVPALGTQITVRGTVKDARGNGLSNITLSFEADTLTNPALAEKSYVGSLDTGSGGGYILHGLPGTYFYTAELPTSESTTPTPSPDAGVAKDAAATPDLPNIFGDAAAFDCTTLTTCCNNLSGTTKSSCLSIAATNTASTCAAYQAILQLAGSCP